MNLIADRILRSLAAHPEIVTKEDFHTFKNAIYADYKLPRAIPGVVFIERYNTLVRSGELTYEVRIWKLLRKRAVRSLSGLSVISILTKPWSCPGRCTFCPTYEGLPKSYVTNEPAVMRAEMNAFDPIRQVQNRLRSLEMTGHAIEKCDVRIIGGTWSAYPEQYREDYIRDVYDAHTTYSDLRSAIRMNDEISAKCELHVQNSASSLTVPPGDEPLKGALWRPSGAHFSREFHHFSGDPENQRFSKITENSNISNKKYASFSVESGFEIVRSATLEEAKRRNETSECRVIGIAIETRPDAVDAEEITKLRRYGVTRVEIGYQTTYDEINARSKRGHGNAESIQTTKLLKDAGFKVVAHMMPNLPGSTPEMDLASLREIFDNPDYRPDELKIYPMVVTKHTEVEQDWRNGTWKPYDDTELVTLMAELQGIIPEYVRLNRMYRDIPSSEILAGSHLANLRQVTDQYMYTHGITRRDISAREIREKGNNPANAILDVTSYEASGWLEYFLQWIDPADRTVFSLLRLRVPTHLAPLTKGGNERSEWGDIEKCSSEIKSERDRPDSRLRGNDGEVVQNHVIFWEIPTAIIRELHTFGDQLRIGERSDGTGQHMGFGKRLMTEAERIVRESHPEITRIAVIAGVGVRAYYARLGYHLEGEYMIKDLR